MRAIRAYLGLASIYAVLALVSPVNAAQINLRVNQHAAVGGTLSYEVSAFPSFNGGAAATLIAPDGTVTSGFGTRIALSGLTYGELSTRFFGQWSIQETTPSSDLYHFTLADLPVLPVPTIVAPLAGETVGTTIFAQWQYPANEIVPGRSIGASGIDPQISFTFGNDSEPNQGMVLVNLGGLTTAQVSVRGGGGYSISDFVSPITPTPPMFPHLIVGTYNSFSAPVTVTVVPEPGGVALAALGIAALPGCYLRRRSR